MAIWNSVDLVLLEAPEHFRKEGELANHHNSINTCAPKCLIRKADLEREVVEDPELPHLFNLRDGIKRVIQQERSRDGFTPWHQGFHPKEHKEMLLNQEALERERRHANRSLMVATLAVVGTVVGTLAGAFINNNSAHIGADATIKAAQMQIEAQKEMSRQPQPINVTVQIPEIKQPTAEKPIPPKTTHGQKPPPP
jgi:hypothetical protein